MISNLTLEERERAAYIRGDIELARALAQECDELEDVRQQLHMEEERSRSLEDELRIASESEE